MKFLYYWPLALGLVACGGDREALLAENAALKKRLETDSLMLRDFDQQMRSVGAVLDSTETLLNPSSGKLETRDFMAKAQPALAALAESETRLAELEAQLAKSNSVLRENAALQRLLDDKQALIQQQRLEIERLQKRVNELSTANQNLTIDLADRERTIVQTQRQLAQLLEELDQIETHRRSLEKRVENNEQTITDNALRDGLNLMQAAKTMKDGALAGKDAKTQKSETVREAYRLLCQAHRRGDYQALGYLRELEKDPKLSKYLDGMSCN